MKIIEDYRKACEAISERFAEITEKSGEWMTDYSLWVTEYEAWDITDMCLILEKAENLSALDLEHLLADVEEWIDYNVAVGMFNIQYINLRSWLMGCPRMSREDIEELHKRQMELSELIEKAQEEFGERKGTSQPEHLQDLQFKPKF